VQFTTPGGSAKEGNSGTSTVRVQATLSAKSPQAVTVGELHLEKAVLTDVARGNF
jgi:hypothetical protein